jgi:hypothetical protein
MALLEIALGHASTNWELYSGIKPISFDPRFWGGIRPFVQNVVRKMWNCCSLRNKSTQNEQSEEMYGGEDFRDATAYAKTLTVGKAILFLEVMLLPVCSFYYEGPTQGLKSAQTVDSTI